MAPARIRPVEGRSRLEWLLRYCIQPPVKHGIGAHPALWSGSCFQDLVGARWLPDLRMPVREMLPRLRLGEVYGFAGMVPSALAPADDTRLRAAGMARLVAAAAAACAAEPRLGGSARPALTARRVAGHLARASGFPTSEVARTLGLDPRSARRLTAHAVDDRALHATRMRLALEDAVRRPGPPTLDPPASHDRKMPSGPG